ncbi:hypothetical protein C7T94_15395 [Pedobacter yulinensis]|uniref:Adenylosuccinate lyase n=1 Tax=Pedobacter yulinensis TaxID=2126353 RepID=A0A2T3HIE9_9SPHI|nr:hypothetical protein [Pedobacter yulinensis]PST82183.1 hypothetical protein C7T94_15395 [Pedobacter yulinensis]
MNHDKPALLAALRVKLSKKKIDHLAEMAAAGYAAGDVFELCFHDEQQVAFRAAWILENIFIRYPDRFSAVTDAFLSRFHEQQNASARRHFAKILSLLSRPASVSAHALHFDGEAGQRLVSTVFDWLIDETVAVAVKAHCLQILANLASRQLWIAEELRQTIAYLQDRESIAFFGKARQVLRQLGKNAATA